MVAKAMVHSPPVLVLDEPTAGVDIELRQQLWSQVRALNKAGTTVLLTTHYLEEAEELCGHHRHHQPMARSSPADSTPQPAAPAGQQDPDRAPDRPR